MGAQCVLKFKGDISCKVGYFELLTSTFLHQKSDLSLQLCFILSNDVNFISSSTAEAPNLYFLDFVGSLKYKFFIFKAHNPSLDPFSKCVPPGAICLLHAVSRN